MSLLKLQMTPSYYFSERLSLYFKRILFKSGQISRQEINNASIDKLLKQNYQYSKKYYFRSNLKLLYRISLLSILVLIPRKKEMNKDVTIVYGLANNQIYRDGSTKKLIDFLLGEKINLIKPGIFIIENSLIKQLLFLCLTTIQKHL